MNNVLYYLKNYYYYYYYYYHYNLHHYYLFIFFFLQRAGCSLIFMGTGQGIDCTGTQLNDKPNRYIWTSSNLRRN